MPDVRMRIVAVESVPRLGFQAHFGQANSVLQQFGIQTQWGMGAYWDQTMYNLFQAVVAQDWDWMLTIDYDTMFSRDNLSSLIGAVASDPSIDAIAPVQAHRNTDSALAYFGGKEKISVTGGPIKAQSAHFGLTLIKVAKLRELPQPWFCAVPDKDSGWGEGRIDADISFWHRWRAAGNTCYVHSGVNVGHLVERVKIHDSEMNIRYVSVEEWRRMEDERSVSQPSNIKIRTVTDDVN